MPSRSLPGTPRLVQFRRVRLLVMRLAPVGMKKGEAGSRCSSAQQAQTQSMLEWMARVLLSPESAKEIP